MLRLLVGCALMLSIMLAIVLIGLWLEPNLPWPPYKHGIR